MLHTVGQTGTPLDPANRGFVAAGQQVTVDAIAQVSCFWKVTQKSKNSDDF